MQAPPFGRMETHTDRSRASSVGPSRQKIPVALLANKECRGGSIRRRARLGPAHRDQMRHGRYRGGREKDRFGRGVVIFAQPSATSVTRAQEETGTLGPAS